MLDEVVVFSSSSKANAMTTNHRPSTLRPRKIECSTIDVVGMTSGVCQGRHYLPAGVLGISTALSQEDWLCPKGRLRQQPAGDSTEESQSRRRRQDPSNGCFAESGLAPTRSTEAKDGHDASHVQTPPTSEQEPCPRKDPWQKGGHMPPRCRSKGEKALYKVSPSDEESGGQRITLKMQPRRSR
jgi:hypothetical protein